jgi:general secretion pathway protein M
MTNPQALERLLKQHSRLAALSYVVVVLGFCSIGMVQLSGLIERYGDLTTAMEKLGKLQGRTQKSSRQDSSHWPPGSPFLEGTTDTLASASLLQRMITSITRAGGTLVSSEVEPQVKQANNNYLKANASCEFAKIEALQQVLHDLEAGMPFLFVDRLSVESIKDVDKAERLRVRLVVSGMWQGSK